MTMAKIFFFAVSFALLTSSKASGAETPKVVYYVQLIHGDDGEKPPVPEAKQIGDKLSQRIRPVFKWRSYWEINRQAVELEPGQKARVRVSSQREVEIDLTRPGKRTVRTYDAGKVVSCSIQPIGECMTITGGDRDGGSAWFIIVRRDKPAN
jgi:hypothetical protein